MGEELNQLMADGFRVFHDVPFDDYNIDHVLVGVTGVFAVETKAKRKPVKQGEKKYRALYDGQTLRFPHGDGSDALNQARRNAKSLEQWLRSATADRVDAEAIVTVPGWYIERTGRGDVAVLAPTEIRKFVMAARRQQLSPEVIQRIAHQLEQKSITLVS